MAFQRLHEFGFEWWAAARRAECAVAGGTAGAAGDLSEFGGVGLAELIAIELAAGRESDGIDVGIEPHADPIGGAQGPAAARLGKGDFAIARARRKGAKPDRWPA